ncbi:MAG: histidine phosphatase family protein [Lachnospiraceae bacterium]|nr:histidine phosphatase family protein [Lachnospiraceae bacterium]
MRLLFIRHGEPDYEKDTLTELGNKQAEACAKRLENEGISEIYASPMGRAYETAAYTAKRLNLPITVLDYMHEIWWGGEGIPLEGHVWTLADKMLYEDNFDFSKKDWREHPYFKTNLATEYFDKVSAKIDEFLAHQGYKHDGVRFLCETDEEKTVAIFSHGGSGAIAMSHILGIPFPYYACVFPYDFTSIIEIDFPVEKGAYVHTRMGLFNDAYHIRGISNGLKLQQKIDNSKP